MPKPTPEDLQEAKRQRAAERAIQIQQEAEEEARRQRKNEWLIQAREQYTKLFSVVSLLYDEVDKLTKKRAEEPVTQLYLKKTNQAVESVKELLAGEEEVDFFAAGIDEDLHSIVAAGDLPARQDMLLILREARAALERFEHRHAKEWRMFGDYY